MGFALSDIRLSSSAFETLGSIPSRYTGEGEDISPPLSWSNAPDTTKAFSLICHDPDAPLVSPGSYGFVHWVLYNIPPSVTSLSEGTQEYTSGTNNMGNRRYNGPMPPPSHGIHHYYFWLLALDAEIELSPGLTMWELLARIEPNVIAMNRLVGTYSR